MPTYILYTSYYLEVKLPGETEYVEIKVVKNIIPAHNNSCLS